jgi:hypothetical protein
MTSRSRLPLFLYLILLILLSASLTVPRIFASPSSFNIYVPVTSYGDTNVEQWSSTIGGNVVQAYLMFSTPTPLLILSVSMYVQYSGSDGSQCMRFGVYLDNGNGSPAGQPLVASTWNFYCLHGSVSWGPDWETWRLRPNDFLNITQPGTYWLAVLATQSFGNVYHYAYSSSYDYTYSYATYYFSTPALQGFPLIFSYNPAWEGNGPYSVYVSGVP